MKAIGGHKLLVAAVVVALAPSLSWGASFALFEHGNRAMAMAGAFTGLADDPSALYWNPAGAAFQTDRGVQVMAGFTLIKPLQDFYGESPYPGDGYEATQEDQVFYPPHFYLLYPLGDRVSLNFSVNTPFGLGTWWEEDFAGRFISKRTDLRLVDISPGVAFRVNDSISFGLGVDYAVGQIDLTKNIGFINPYTQQLADVGQVHLHTDDMSNDGFGWNASMLAKLPHGFSLGLLYRSGIDVDYEGIGSFTQYATGYADFDALLASRIPFGEKVPLETAIDFPEYWSVGLAWTTEQWAVSASYGAMGWSSFQELPITFTENPELSDTVEELYDDTSQYRLGVEYKASESWAFQGGVLFDETPQPPESMSPLLGDGDRTGVSVGLSWMHGAMRTDVGYMYLMFDERSTEGYSLDGYYGRYDSKAHLLGASLSLRF